MDSGAVLSPCGRFRYRLWRVWDASLPRCVWVMLNPSTADASKNDPTIRAIMDFARAWGYGGIEVVNLFAWRSPDPKALLKADDPIGPANDAHILEVCRPWVTIVAAWGNHGWLRQRDAAVTRLLLDDGHQLSTLGVTGAGQPKHPLYVKRDTPLTMLDAGIP